MRINLFLAALLFCRPDGAFGFCGFYVAKADSSLYNKASQVVIARNGDRTALTMANDYKGDPKEFALVVPVPVVLHKNDVKVVDPELISHLDAYSAPRLVEYFDADPCIPTPRYKMFGVAAVRGGSEVSRSSKQTAKALGVTIEEKFTAGEYDILILSAQESAGLETWLTQEGYRLPKNASTALGPYIKLKLKFFVAKVNLKEKEKSGFAKLRPLQFAFKDPHFMLPLRLGMLNADGPQDLMVYAITKVGRVESTNYRTVDVPTDREIPTYVRGEFARVYPALFERAWNRQDRRSVLTEYTWDLNWCDPCAAEPPTREELEKLGVNWFADEAGGASAPSFMPRGRTWGGGPLQARITRMHVRYEPATWPEDLVFQETTDRRNFQARYILRHRWQGKPSCQEAKEYLSKKLPERESKAVAELSALTGWDQDIIRSDWKKARASGKDESSRPKEFQ
ncbi:MAG: DUF2330 domain-containing protein [Elusimicrobia bacterium]|nr:DUF2330 domain-containing protein [Elusimicrobiota bacterium]